MSIPSYVLNWEELLDIIGDKLQVNIEDIELGDLEDFLKANLDAIIELLNQILELLKNRGTQRVHSISNHIPAVVGVYKFTTTFDYDIFLTGITYSQSGWKYQDSWDLMVGENLLFDEVCTKELGEQKQFNVFYFVPAGTPIDILFHNDSGNSRLIWFDIEYLGLSTNSSIPVPEPIPPEDPTPPEEPEEPEEPAPAEKLLVHFCGIFIGQVEKPDNWSHPTQPWSKIYAEFLQGELPNWMAPEIPSDHRKHSDILPVGEYPVAIEHIRNAQIKTTLDSIAVAPNVRLRYYSKEYFNGELLLDVVGPCIIYNSHWEYVDYFLEQDFINSDKDNEMFPKEVRMKSDSDMHDWRGSFIISKE